jgi:hypothetical protein
MAPAPGPAAATDWRATRRAHVGAVGVDHVAGLLAIVVLAGVFHFGTLREGHHWGDDFSQYILHARNLVVGRTYSDTGQIDNPDRPVGPSVYPPVFPALLAGVYAVRGVDLVAMKAVVAACFLLMLVAVFLACRAVLPPGLLLALVALLAFNPYFWRFRDGVLSDIPFTAFAYLALAMMDRLARAPAASPPGLALALGTGAVGYLAYGTRSIGIVLLPVLVLNDLRRQRRVAPLTWIAGGTLVAAVVMQRVLLPVDVNYLGMYRLDVPRLAAQALDYVRALGVLWEDGLSPLVTGALLVVASGLAVVGFVLRMARGPGAGELFVLCYLPPVVLFPALQGARYLIPVLPLYLAYALLGLQRCLGLLPYRARVAGLAALALTVALNYGAAHARADLGPLPDGVGTPESRAFFAFVREGTPADAVFVCRKPRALALFGDRAASVYHLPPDDGRLWSYLEGIRASHLVLGPFDDAAWRRFVARHAGRLHRVYASPEFDVLRIVRATSPARARSAGALQEDPR